MGQLISLGSVNSLGFIKLAALARISSGCFLESPCSSKASSTSCMSSSARQRVRGFRDVVELCSLWRLRELQVEAASSSTWRWSRMGTAYNYWKPYCWHHSSCTTNVSKKYNVGLSKGRSTSVVCGRVRQRWHTHSPIGTFSSSSGGSLQTDQMHILSMWLRKSHQHQVMLLCLLMEQNSPTGLLDPTTRPKLRSP